MEILDSIMNYYSNLNSDQNLNKYQKTIYNLSKTAFKFEQKGLNLLFDETAHFKKGFHQNLKKIDAQEFILLNKSCLKLVDSLKEKNLSFDFDKLNEKLQDRLSIYEIQYSEYFFNILISREISAFIKKHKDKIYKVKKKFECVKKFHNNKCFLDTIQNTVTYFHYKNRKANYYESYNSEHKKISYSSKNRLFSLSKRWLADGTLIEKKIDYLGKSKLLKYYPNSKLESVIKTRGKELISVSATVKNDTIVNCSHSYKERKLIVINDKLYYENGKPLKIKFFFHTKKYNTDGKLIEKIIYKS